MVLSAPTPIEHRLDYGDQLARGELIHVLQGQTVYCKLTTPAQWQAYRDAKARGYLVVPSTGDTRRRLRNVWCSYTEARGLPLVVVEQRRTWAMVEIDMILLPPRSGERDSCWRLDDANIERIRANLAEHTRHGSWWSHGGVYSHSPAIPIAVAEQVAHQLFTIGCEDLGVSL
jgi:hypothetical protein